MATHQNKKQNVYTKRRCQVPIKALKSIRKSDDGTSAVFTPPASEICRVGFQLIKTWLVGFSPRSEVLSLIEIVFWLNTFGCGVRLRDKTWTLSQGLTLSFWWRRQVATYMLLFSRQMQEFGRQKVSIKKILLQIIHRNMKLLNSFVCSASNTRISYSWTIGKASKTCTETFQCVSFEKTSV